MVRNKILLLIIALSFLLSSCIPGYQKEEGRWAWVTYDEAVGKRIQKMEVDQKSFQILEHWEYGKDKNSVFYRGSKIQKADPETFKIINDRGYSKDKNNVYLDQYMVIFANPQTFKPLDWPYSKDSLRIYCGTLPMDVNNPEEFTFVESNGLHINSDVSFFIEMNPEYDWLDTLDIEAVVIGKGKGKTKTERFNGFKKIQ